MTAVPAAKHASCPPSHPGPSRQPPSRQWFSTASCALDDFIAVVGKETRLEDYAYADAVESNVLIYGNRVRGYLGSSEERADVQAELIRALTTGPGIVVFKGAFQDTAVVDRATHAFNELIEAQKANGVAGGDHFAKPGANDRVWGALDKLALSNPAVYSEYYANDVLALISEAWLGPNYQVTSQINVVNPGGKAQTSHRDYHLGFMSSEEAQRYPAHIHLLSPALTLQGAVAQCDMPLESGPTLYLPHSHKYDAGYIGFHDPEFTAYFQQNHVQLPLEKGDAAFFNPAVFHGAGTNRSAGIRRMANLLQVSSAFGRAMESVDRTAISRAIYPELQKLQEAGAGERMLRNVIAVSAEGYSFPTNLDRDQPIGGMAPEAQAELLWKALDSGMSAADLETELESQQRRRLTEGN
ncbi:phytanoyl-CoA dioxygenase family protein [Pseudarthrobacter sp. N5]|uniref:phytanoyl-CoA dioxygenase family protein n=1 Tax=Pseudarthrobacter sp. N5 TaxID=3418416 RepID=UPI003CFA58A6